MRLPPARALARASAPTSRRGAGHPRDPGCRRSRRRRCRSRRAEVDEAELVLDVRERRQDRAVGERAADTALAVAAVAARAARVDLGADAERARRPPRVRVSDRAYMNSPAAAWLSAAIAQNGIFLRFLAAATYGGRASAEAAGPPVRAALRPTGPLGGGGVAAAAGVVAAGSRRAHPAPPAADASSPPSPSAARRSRDRFSRCSGISVTRRHDRRRRQCAGKHSGPVVGVIARTCAQPPQNRDTVVPDCTSSQTCGATTVRASVHEGESPPDARQTDTAHDRPAERPESPETERHDQPMLAIDILKWPGVNVPFLVSFLDLAGADLRGGAVRQAAPGRHVAVVGRGDARRHVRVRRDVPRLRRRPPRSGSTTPTRSSAGARTYIIYGPGGILKPQSAGGWNPITLQYEAVRDIVVVLIHVFFFGLLICVWHWWQKPRRPADGHRDRDEHLRPPAGEEGLIHDGQDRRQPPDDAVHRRVHARRGRRGLPDQGRQAEAVHPHRPDRVHHVRGVRRHLPVEVHPHGARRRDRRGHRHRATGRRSRATRSCSSSTTTSARAARCASIAARRASSSSARSAPPA